MNYDTLLVDGSYLAHRSFDAPYKLITSKGRDSTMIHSFVRTLNSLYKQFKPNHIIVAWESPGTPSWRRELYSAYKRGRGRLNSQFIYQLNDIQKLLFLFDIIQYSAPNNEADDVLAAYMKSNGYCENVLIYTVDKDIMQLVTDGCHIFNDKTKEIFDISKVKEKYGVYPNQIPDLLAIVGDKSDNIEGIEGYGYKKAVKILENYGFIEHIPTTEVINKFRIKLLLNKKLTMLNSNCWLTPYQYNGHETIESIMDKYELKKMKENIDEYKSMGGDR